MINVFNLYPPLLTLINTKWLIFDNKKNTYIPHKIKSIFAKLSTTIKGTLTYAEKMFRSGRKKFPLGTEKM